MILCEPYSNFANGILSQLEGTFLFNILLPIFQGLWDIFFVPVLGCN